MSDEPDAKAKPEDDLLERAIADYKRSADRERDDRENWINDVRFGRLGEQWDAELRKTRQKDGRPCLTINKLPVYVRQVVNDARQNKPAIKVLPQDSGADPKTAEVLTGLIRNIESSSSGDIAYDTALDCAASGGFGYFRINLDYAHDESWDQDIILEAVPDPLRVYGDPDSERADSSDWNVAFVTQMMSKEAFRKRWPDHDADDFPAEKWPQSWREGDQIMVAEYWVREAAERVITLLSNGDVTSMEEYEANAESFAGQEVFPVGEPRTVPSYKVTQHIMTGVTVLESNEWAGKYIPIIPVYGETVYLEGKRHLRSLIRDAKDPQVMFNAWRTASTELVALAPKAPFIGEEGAFDVDAKWETANSASHAYLEFKKGHQRPERQPFAGVPAGALQEALNASDDIKAIVGIFDAGVGARSNETSGKAIMARQRESDTSTFHFIDNLSRSIEHAGRIMLDLIPKVYTVGRIIRILGEDGTPSAAQVGDPQQQPQGDEQVADILPIYNLGAGKYDLTVSVGPAFNSRREEAAQQMIELLRAFPAAAPVIGDLLAKNLDWPGADEIAERLQMVMQQQMQAAGGGGNQEAAQAMQQLQQQVQELTQRLQQTEADKSIDAGKLDVDVYEAETKRLKVIADANKPTSVPRAAAPARQG